MQSVLQVAVYDATVPAVIGISAFLILALALGFVRNLGKFRPHSK